MKSSNGTYYQTVLVEKSDNKSEQIIGSATLVIERKFIHNCATRGLIEGIYLFFVPNIVTHIHVLKDNKKSGS